MRLLFVCTGNLCRSPAAERLTRLWADEALGGNARDVHLASAGLAAESGRPMHPHSAAALARLGGRPDGFTSRPFEASMAEAADLVLTMSRSQRRAVLERTPKGLRRTYTLLEAADLLTHADLSGLAEVPLTERAVVLAARLDGARRKRPQAVDDDIGDPINGSAPQHRRTVARIASPLRALTAVLFTGVPLNSGAAGDLTTAAPARRPG